MRARIVLPALLLAACSGRAPPGPTGDRAAWPLDGFLAHLPAETSAVVRLPTAASMAEHPEVTEALLRLLGHPTENPQAILLAVPQPEGLDPTTAPGLAATTGGGVVHYLPAADKAALNRSLAACADRCVIREEGRWILLSRGGAEPGATQGSPLPPGDLALRLSFYPLLSDVLSPGDAVEAGFALGTGGTDFEGRVRPAEGSVTATLLAQAYPIEDDLLDFLPAGLAVRVETSLPPTFLASFLAARVATHAGMKDGRDRTLTERFLREALTALDGATGLAFGLEFLERDVTVVAIGRIAAGPPSPLLARLRTAWRTSFGALVLDAREAPAGLVGLSAWVAEAEPRLEGLPETAWTMLADLAGGEERGVPIAFGEVREWCVVAFGIRADALVASVTRLLRTGSTRSPGSVALQGARARGQGAYLLGVVVHPPAFAELAAADRAALRALWGATEDASTPSALAVAGLARDGELALTGRLLY